MSEIKPREVTFGELYEDGSGYLWRVALVRQGNGEWGNRVEVGEAGSDNCYWIDPAKSDLRAIAFAFNSIADMLEQPDV